jgi:hypothetical protein
MSAIETIFRIKRERWGPAAALATLFQVPALAFSVVKALINLNLNPNLVLLKVAGRIAWGNSAI